MNWFLMLPCIGVPRLGIPPLCRWAELTDGTYTIADVERFHQALAYLVEKADEAERRSQPRR